MRRICFGLFLVMLGPLGANARKAERTDAYDAFIAEQARKHGVPERLVHRVVKRESGYNPRLVNNACFGLMQIKPATARSMGYRGDARGLLDPHINMTYAIPYLANAYRLAGGDEDHAVTLFASGYYATAKRKQMIAELRTAESPPLAPEPAAPQPPRQTGGLLAFLATGSPPQQAPRADYPPQAEQIAAAPTAEPMPGAAPAHPGEAAAMDEAPAADGDIRVAKGKKFAFAPLPPPRLRPPSLDRAPKKARPPRRPNRRNSLPSGRRASRR